MYLTIEKQTTNTLELIMKIEKEYFDQDIKVTRIAMKKTKNTTIIKSKLHAKKNRPCKSSAPSTKCVSSVYSGVGFLTEKEMHRSLSPLAAQSNQARDNY
tara:strand:+ start:87 stop:386 length:300 start_codon:yes stop_codon:yes gene_type:complete